MKHYLSYILLFVSSCCYLNGMEQNKFLICNKIKQIDPKASPAEYFELAQNLSKNDLSTCACMTYLMRKREEKAIGLITKNFVSQNSEKMIQETCKQQQEKDANEKNGIPLAIHCSPSLDSIIQADIANKFSGKYRTTIVSTEEFCGTGVLACVRRPITYEKSIDGSNPVKFNVENPEMGISASFKKLSSNARNAVLAHEKYHLEENHSLLQILRSFFLRNNNNSFDEDQKKVYAKLKRAHEAAADRVPAACNDCKLASDFVERYGDYSYGLMNGFIITICRYLKKRNTSSPQTNIRSFEHHPSSEKKLQWAQRIYNLKLAEQEIKKNERLALIRNKYFAKFLSYFHKLLPDSVL